MLTVTTPSVEGKAITAHYGIVTGNAIVGANLFRDFFARVRDVVGGYERALGDARRAALDDMIAEAEQLGANAIVAIDLDYETVGDSMLMVSAAGTAVRIE